MSHEAARAGEPPRVGFCQSASEAVMLAMACLAPWAFGAVDTWAEFGLDIGGALVAVLGFADRWGSGRSGSRLGGPGLALVGLALLAVAQVVALPERVLSLVSPATAALRAAVIPNAPERVLDDPDSPVP